jgi:hypothetical protein
MPKHWFVNPFSSLIVESTSVAVKSVPCSLDKQGGRSCHFLLFKRRHLIQLFCLTNPVQDYRKTGRICFQGRFVPSYEAHVTMFASRVCCKLPAIYALADSSKAVSRIPPLNKNFIC